MLGGREGRKLLYFLAAIFGALFLSGFLLHHTLSALLTSLVTAFLLNPLLNYAEGRGFRRLPAITLTYIIVAILLLILSLAFLPYLAHQTNALTREMPHYVQNVKGALQKWQVALAPYYSGEEGEWLIDQAGESLSKVTEVISGLGLARLKGALFGVFNLVLAPILVFFMLMYKDAIKRGIIRFIPAADQERLLAMGAKINRTLERFILAMALDCLMVGALSALALYLLHIEFPLLNGMIAGFASIVPVLGAVVAVIPPAFVGYANSGDLMIIPKVCAAYFIVHVVIEGNLIKPLIMKGALKLNPLAVIFAVMAMGELLGFWGIVLAVPLTAIVKICADEVRRLRAERGTS
ncbi:MAG TPA: AI-2E family transporter [Geobacteraceae bacterium]